MRTRHMIALLLGVAPIVAAGQIATAQPPVSPNQSAPSNGATADPGMANGSTPAGEGDNATAPDAMANVTGNTANGADDAPPQ